MRGWIGVDLDGTLAVAGKWEGLGVIGAPVPAMVERVKLWLAHGVDVRIVTARANPDGAGGDLPLALRTIDEWCAAVFGRPLPVTCCKDFAMLELWDDRAVSIEKNTGRITCEYE